MTILLKNHIKISSYHLLIFGLGPDGVNFYRLKVSLRDLLLRLNFVVVVDQILAIFHETKSSSGSCGHQTLGLFSQPPLQH